MKIFCYLFSVEAVSKLLDYSEDLLRSQNKPSFFFIVPKIKNSKIGDYTLLSLCIRSLI